ncbi:MAG: oxidoreductase [Bacteroidetes bacterium]|jgi:predicted dehydrogenase|nr:oxidoreductase [Bacteroidota bacterium]
MKFGFVGYGSIAKKHIKAINSLFPDASCLIVRRAEDGKGMDAENANCTISTNMMDLLEVDFIFITNPTFLHVETIEMVLKFQKPLFIEKPLASSLDLVPEMIRALDRLRIPNYVACNMRFHICMNFLKKELLPGLRINEVNVYCGSYLPDWRPGTDFRKSYSSNENMGGGVHLDLIHELDYCYYLFGAPKQHFNVLTKKSALEINAIDYAHYHWQYKDFSAQITLNYFRRDYKRTLEIVAEDATYLVDFKNGKVERNGEVIFSDDPDVNVMYQRQISYFVNCVKEKKKCFNDVQEAYNVLKLCLNGS